MIKYVIWDFNGTILDDRELTFNLLNELLKQQNKEPITFAEYLDVFDFPIKEYYAKAGLSVTNKSFMEMAKWFIDVYQPASLRISLVPNLVKTLDELSKLGVKHICLSASEINNLTEQLAHYKIDHYFHAILGTSNIHAIGKKDVGLKYLKENKIDPNDCILVGDTTEDCNVAEYLGVKPILYSGGHQSVKRLRKRTSLIIDDLYDILKLINFNKEE